MAYTIHEFIALDLSDPADSTPERDDWDELSDILEAFPPYPAYARTIAAALPADHEADDRLDAFLAERMPRKQGRLLQRKQA